MIAESDKILFWVIVVGVISLCMILMMAWTTNLKKIYTDDALQPMAYETRLIYSDKCFAYKDASTGRVYTGTIDPSKFNEQTMFNCLPLDSMSGHAISATLETKDANGNKFGLTIKSPNWEMKANEVTMRTYVVDVEGYGPGMLTFQHKSGK